MVANVVLRRLGMAEFDPPPFSGLQGIIGLGALLTATVQQSMNPDLVLAALDERSELDEKLKAVGKAKEGAGGNG